MLRKQSFALRSYSTREASNGDTFQAPGGNTASVFGAIVDVAALCQRGMLLNVLRRTDARAREDIRGKASDIVLKYTIAPTTARK
jgi:hypothetical protein